MMMEMVTQEEQTNDLKEVLVIKEVDKKMQDGEDIVHIFEYLKQKYPKAIDKMFLSVNI